MIFPVKRLADLGFEVLATQGTAEVLRRSGVAATVVRKHFEGEGPGGEKTIVQLIHDGEIDLIVNTPHGMTGGGSSRIDGYEIRTAAVMANIPCITTVQGLGAAVQGIEAMRAADIGVCSLQECGRPRCRWRRGPRVNPYHLLFDDGASAAPTPSGPTHHGVPGDPGCRPGAAGVAAASPDHAPRRWAWTSPGCSGSRGLRQERDRRRRAGASASASSRSARSPASRSPATPGRGCSGSRRPRRGQPDGLQQRRCRGGRRAAGRPGRRRTGRRPGVPGRQHRQDQGGARRTPRSRDYEKSTDACSRRTPTTSWSTSARRTPPACATCRPSPRWSPLLRAVRAPRRRRRRPATCRCWSRSRPTWRRRRARRRRPRARARPGRHHRHQHHDRPRRPAGPGRRSRRPGGRALRRAAAGPVTGGARGCARARGPAGAGRGRRDRDLRGRLGAAPGRRRPGAGLHRLRLRGAALDAAVHEGLGARLRASGYRSIAEAVGTGVEAKAGRSKA